MSDKTCGECKYFVTSNYLDVCVVECETRRADSVCNLCGEFKPKVITNGDVIRQMSNEELVMILTGEGCKYCIYRGVNFKGFTVTCRYPDKTRIPDCSAGILAWFNAPADCVAENGESAKQADLCCKSAKESEGKDK
jgi:hypothetical protein